MLQVRTTNLALSEWIEENVHLPTGVSAEPGPIKLYKYQKAIASAISDRRVERVSALKSASIGYSAGAFYCA